MRITTHGRHAAMRTASIYPHLLACLTHTVLEPAVGARYLAIADWLRDFTSWSDERRLAWQRQQLTTVLEYACEVVPFYRARFSRTDGRRLSLDSFPIVDKAKIRADLDAFLPPGWRERPYIPKRTGGTSGDPWQYPLDRRAWAHMYGAAIHFKELTGYRYGEPMVLFGTPTSLGVAEPDWKSRLRHKLERHHLSQVGFALDEKSSRDRLAYGLKANAAVWYGYASTIAAMADVALAQKKAVEGPRAIITTAETLQPVWRQRIEKAFGPRLYDEYGCNDGGILAQTCRHGRFHVAENISVVEILEGEKRCPPGVEGDVVVTNLHARVLPFIRYKIGDRAVLGEGPCPCGIPGTILDRLGGRAWDYVQLRDGTRVSSVAFNPVFIEIPGVRRWQVVQPSLDQLIVRLDVDSSFINRQAEVIRRYVIAQCPGVQVDLSTTEPIERTQGGKHKAVVRKIELGTVGAAPSRPDGH